MPKDVIVVIPCPACHELVVIFRNKAAAVDRKTLVQGTREEQVSHLAAIISEFLEPGVSLFDLPSHHEDGAASEQEEGPSFDSDVGPITDSEVRRFLQVDLKLIDNPTYFRKHFG